MDRADFRIIDANFNRAREGLRVVEDFCRFSLNSQQLAGRCKKLRHQLCSAVMQLNIEKMIANRDTAADIGCDLKIAAQLKRTNIEDCLTAAFGRATEALRVLAEITAIDGKNEKIVRKIEQIRYEIYTLQKDIMLEGTPAIKFKEVRLYCIVGAGFKKGPLELAQACADGGADCIQLRIKNISDKDFLSLACKFVEICKKKNVLSIINDRVDIAGLADADGVHLGQNDISVEQARNCCLKPLIIGKSTHSLAELKAAIIERPTYIATGAVFATTTKENVKALGLDYVKEAEKILHDNSIHHVVIGGINTTNIESLLATGLQTVAILSHICNAENPTEICERLKKLLVEYNKQ